ncbi:uncharacterized protein [Littorina saxatilis]
MSESSGYRIPPGNQVPAGKMSGQRSSFVLLGVFTGFLALCCLGLVGVIIWREYYTDSGSPESPMINITIIKQRFPGYFRTPQEQVQIERDMNFDPIVRPVRNVSTVHQRCFFNGHCENKPPSSYPTGRRRRQTEFSDLCELDRMPEKDLTYHGCCVSYTAFIQPTTLPTAQPGQTGEVPVAQFPRLKQYFSIQECCQALGCTGCQCSQTYYTVSAVVKRGAIYKVEYVRVPGCCQCLNTFPTS